MRQKSARLFYFIPESAHQDHFQRIHCQSIEIKTIIGNDVDDIQLVVLGQFLIALIESVHYYVR